MRLILTPGALGLGLDGAVAALISPVVVRRHDPALDKEIHALERRVRTTAAATAASPEVQGFKTLFECLGYPDQTPAGERLLSRIRERGFPRYSNIVDAYNIVVARHICGLGMHDASTLRDPDDIVVRLARGNERITPLLKDRQRPVQAGDLIYGPARHIDAPMAWLGRSDIDADNWKVTGTSEQVLLVVLGNSATSRQYNEQICRKAHELVRRSCRDAKLTLLDTVVAPGH